MRRCTRASRRSRPTPGVWNPPDPLPSERRHDRRRPGTGTPFAPPNASPSLHTLITEAPPTSSARALSILEPSVGATVASAATPALVPTWAKNLFSLRRAEIEKNLRRFNAPNSTNARNLFIDTLEFNPWPDWNWHAGPRQWNGKQMPDPLNCCVLIRHSVAHGFPLPDDIQWILSANGKPRLTLSLLRECKNFFVHVATQTDSAFAGHLCTHHGIPAP